MHAVNPMAVSIFPRTANFLRFYARFSCSPLAKKFTSFRSLWISMKFLKLTHTRIFLDRNEVKKDGSDTTNCYKLPFNSRVRTLNKLYEWRRTKTYIFHWRYWNKKEKKIDKFYNKIEHRSFYLFYQKSFINLQKYTLLHLQIFDTETESILLILTILIFLVLTSICIP